MDYGSNYYDYDFAHPRNKKHIGDRLAYLALAKIYDYKNYSVSDYGSPYMYMSTVKDGYVYFYFNNVGTGLRTTNNSQNVKGFTNYITGSSLPATLEGTNCVKVRIGSAEQITIAYGDSAMADRSTCTLSNSNGIGALAFKYEVTP